ncbi:hypothetical protein [Chitinophaga sp. LS1]|uniref:hypothetical protein n=1 Tax=Chitinophaga sp. LS1 TaxID=3051176 RepID=UPI002AAB1BA5|nr:hypothetical protein [Chitinophaga sp. LS1]WPV66269.1 hypothetical protein QQL36_31215 [Chitinophaga sp. LS1]
MENGRKYQTKNGIIIPFLNKNAILVHHFKNMNGPQQIIYELIELGIKKRYHHTCLLLWDKILFSYNMDLQKTRIYMRALVDRLEIPAYYDRQTAEV